MNWYYCHEVGGPPTDIRVLADYTLNEINNNQQGRQETFNGGVGVGIQQFGGGSGYMNNTTTFLN